MARWDPKTVVVGVDGSDGSIKAVGVAAALARHNNATLHIVTVVRPPEGWWGVVGSPPSAESLGDAMSKAQRDILDRALEAVDLEGVTHETSEELGDPAHSLVSYCSEHEADVLVIGKRGSGLVERIVVGSVADRVVHMAGCPVLVVP